MTQESRDRLVAFVAALAERLRRTPVRGAGFAADVLEAHGATLVDPAAEAAGIDLVLHDPPLPITEPEPYVPTVDAETAPAAPRRPRKPRDASRTPKPSRKS